MVSKKGVLICMLGLQVVLVGCKEKATNAPVEATPAPQAAASVDAEAAFVPVEGVVFEAVPGQIRSCDVSNGRTKVELKWDATAAGVKFVNIYAAKGSGEPKLFVTAKAAGEKTTGEWIVDGAKLILEDASTKRKLGEIRFNWEKC